MLLRRLGRGLWEGLLLGLLYALTDTVVLFVALRVVVEMALHPFTALTPLLMLGMVLFSMMLGLVLWPLFGSWLEKGRGRLIHLQLPLMLLIVVVLSDELNNKALGAAGLVATYVMGVGLLLLTRNKPRRWAAVSVLPPLWLGIMLAINPKGSSEPMAGAERPIPEGKPNILWVVYDTVRADHISAYGYPKQTSPNFDALAREGTVFDKTYTSAAWTVESHASMFTGKYASQHGCRHPTLFLGEQHKTIAQFLTEAGYDSSLYAGNPWLDHSTGLARGILDLSPTWRFSTTIAFSFVGRFWIDHIQGGGDKGAGLTNESFKHWYEAKRDKKRPFFAFVNYLEAHAPYFAVSPEDRHKFLPEGASDAEASELSAKIFNHMVFGLDYEFSRREMDIILAMYDAGIHNADRRMGELLDVLRKDGTLDNTLVIVTADHGELFDEHNMWGHDLALYNEVVHVPLVIRYPAKMPAGMRSDKPVQLLDLFATVMSAAGLSDRMPADARAQDILPLVAGGGDVNRPLFGEYFTPRMPPLVRDIQKMGKDPATFHINSVQQSNLKLIRWSDEARLFDLATDPREQTDLSSSRAEDKQRLNALIDDFVKANQAGTGGSSGGGELDEAMKQRLKSLGYIQ